MNLKISGFKKITILLTAILFIIAASGAYSTAADEKQTGKSDDANIFTSEDINRMNVSSITDLLERVPGVIAAGRRVSINGSTEIAVLLDGRSIKDPISGQIKWDQVSLNNIGRIEILKGGGTQYSENSSGGVILITSKMADAFKGNIEAAMGNMNYLSYGADIQTRLNEVKIGIMAGYTSDDGWRENEHKKVARAGLNLSFEPGDDINISPSFSYLKDVKGLGGPYFAPTLYNETTFENFSATLLAGIRGINSKTIFSDSTDQSVDEVPAPIPHNISINPRIFSQEFSTDFYLSGIGRLDAGLGYEYATIDVETNINNVQMPFDTHREKKAWMFATYKYDPDDNPFSVYLGLRGIYYNNFENIINPELILSYQKETYGAVFSFNLNDRLPGYRDRYRSDAFVIANPNLEKEEYMNLKLTLLYSPTDSLSFNITPYYSEIEKLISMDTINTADGLRRTFANVGSATEKGIDSNITWKPDPRFNLSLSYDLKSAKDDATGLWLPMRAKHRFQGRIMVTPVERLAISTTLNWVSGEFSNRDNTMRVKSYYKADARIEYFINNINLFFQIENMFDRDYIEPFLIPAKTRSFYTGVKYSF